MATTIINNFKTNQLFKADAIYSLRKIRLGYNGACLRIRRSSDNSTADIGFAGNVLDTASLLSFVGMGNGTVATWYDQSGFNRNIVGTEVQWEPFIAVNGVIQMLLGKPSVFGGNKLSFLLGDYTFNQPNTFICVAHNPVPREVIAEIIIDGGTGGRNNFAWQGGSTTVGFFAGINRTVTIAGEANPMLIAYSHNSPFSYLRINNQVLLQNQSTGAEPLQNLIVFASDNPTGLGSSYSSRNAYISELIIFNKNRQSSIGLIEASVNNYYGIY